MHMFKKTRYFNLKHQCFEGHLNTGNHSYPFRVVSLTTHKLYTYLAVHYVYTDLNNPFHIFTSALEVVPHILHGTWGLFSLDILWMYTVLAPQVPTFLEQFKYNIFSNMAVIININSVHGTLRYMSQFPRSI
jgi:hypothetical protein